jgi:hypothetical protein
LENQKNQKSEKFNLSWLCPQTGKKTPAGVAFFNETQGDYRLKIDAFPDDKTVCLKPTGTRDGTVYFRVETVVRRAGQVTHRTQIGSGYAKSESGLPVFMDVGPYSKTLMMEDLRTE